MADETVINWFEDLYATEKRAVLKIQEEYKVNHPKHYITAVDFFLDVHDRI